MPWFKVDDQCALHPKIVTAGNAAFGAWVRMGCYCNQQLTNGLVVDSVARVIASVKELDAMCSAGLAHRVDGGYQIHDYLKYQPSKETVIQRREATKKRVNAHRNKVGNSVTPPVGNAVGTTPLLGTGSGSEDSSERGGAGGGEEGPPLGRPDVREVAIGLTNGWMKCCLAGVPSISHFEDLAAELCALPLDQLPDGDIGYAMAKAFVIYRAVYIERKGIPIPAKPSKLFEHWQNVLEIATGKLDPTKMYAEKPATGRAEPTQKRMLTADEIRAKRNSGAA